MKNYKFSLPVILITIALLALYGIFSYIVVIKVQNAVFLSSINQGIVEINVKLNDIEAKLHPYSPRHYKKVYQGKQKEAVSVSDSHRLSGNRGFIIKNGNPAPSCEAP